MSESSTCVPSALGVIIESQLDWLTCGFDAGPKADRAEAWAFSRARAEERGGYKPLPFRVYGFEGYATGRVRFGRRDDLALVQLSGDLAEKYADVMYAEADRISRVDMAVTVQLPERALDVAALGYTDALGFRADHPKAAIPRLVQDGDDGATLYIGRRTSDRMLRLYNKESECIARNDMGQAEHYARCWRYELELKAGTAWETVEKLMGEQDRAAKIASWMWTYCVNHGIAPRFGTLDPGRLVPGFRRRSDTESRMTWLRKAVNPAILTLMQEVDRAEILDALGLGGAESS